jgi:hypothetical protein
MAPPAIFIPEAERNGSAGVSLTAKVSPDGEETPSLHSQ